MPVGSMPVGKLPAHGLIQLDGSLECWVALLVRFPAGMLPASRSPCPVGYLAGTGSLLVRLSA